MYVNRYSVALVLSAVLTPFAGQAVDKYGVQSVGTVAVALFGGALLGLSYSTTALQLGICFCVLRFAGPECLYVCSNTTLYRWWVKRRGMIAMIRSLDEAFLTGFPALIGPLLLSIGWRATYRAIAAAALVLGFVAMWVFRSKPEDYGLLPDGEAPLASNRNHKHSSSSSSNEDSPSKESAAAADKEPDWMFTEVVRSSFFWKAVSTDCIFKLFWAGLNLHNVDVFALHGIDQVHVANLSVPFSAGIVVGEVLVGLKLDRLSTVQRKSVIVAAYAGLLICQGWLLLSSASSTLAVNTVWRASVWYGVYGACAGVTFVVTGILIADVYGRRALGSVNGITAALGTASSGLGPLLFGFGKEKFNTYDKVIQVLFFALLVAAFAFSVGEIPKPPAIRGGRAAPPRFNL